MRCLVLQLCKEEYYSSIRWSFRRSWESCIPCKCVHSPACQNQVSTRTLLCYWRCTDTLDLRYFGPKTFRHWCRSVHWTFRHHRKNPIVPCVIDNCFGKILNVKSKHECGIEFDVLPVSYVINIKKVNFSLSTASQITYANCVGLNDVGPRNLLYQSLV